MVECTPRDHMKRWGQNGEAFEKRNEWVNDYTRMTYRTFFFFFKYIYPLAQQISVA